MTRKIMIILWSILCSVPLLAANPKSPADSLYREAILLEKSGNYELASSFMDSLYTQAPTNYSYYQKYRHLLSVQRNFDELKLLLEDRFRRFPHNLSLEMELGVLEYHVGRISRAKAHWQAVYKKGKRSFSSSYAIVAYNRIVEYKFLEDFPAVVAILREISNDPALLYRQYFMLTLRYMQWDKASDELLHVCDTHPEHLKYLDSDMFRVAHTSPFFEMSLKKLSQRNSAEAHITRSRLLFHQNKYDAAVNELLPLSAQVGLTEMKRLLLQMQKKDEHEYVIRCARYVSENSEVPGEKDRMLMVMAQSHETCFRSYEIPVSSAAMPYEGSFTCIPFPSIEDNDHAQQAMLLYDSLIVHSRKLGPDAAYHRGNFQLFILNNSDAAEKDCRIALEGKSIYKTDAIITLAQTAMYKGDWQAAKDIIISAPDNYSLSGSDEDKLLPWQFIADFLCGEQDSSIARVSQLTSLINENDPQYNDILNLLAYIMIMQADSNYTDMAVRLEREIRQNHLAQAAEICLQIPPNTQSRPVFLGRYLDLIRHLDLQKRETDFWNDYSSEVTQSIWGDFFIFRQAEFMEKNNAQIKKVIEKYEEVLLTYPVSPFCYPARDRIRLLKKEGYSHE